MYGLAGWVIWALHVAFVAYMAWAPFSHNEGALALSVMLWPLIWVHWVLMDDTCALTLLERRLRGVSSEKSFFHNLVSPVYKIRDEHVRMLAWAASVGLWLVSVARVWRSPGLLRRAFFR